MRGLWLVTGAIAVVVAGAAVAWFAVRRPPPATSPAPGGPREAPSGAVVEWKGTLRARNVTALAAPVDGVAEEFAVKPGDEVYEGQILGRISNEALTEAEHEAGLELERAQNRAAALDSELIAARLEESRLSAELARTRVDLDRAQKVYERQAMLNEAGATPRNTFERAEREYGDAKKSAGVAEALAVAQQDRVRNFSNEIELAQKELAAKQEALRVAKGELAAADIVSPVDGLVLSIGKHAGEQVHRGMPDLITIGTDLTQLELAAEAEPKLLRRVKAGDEAVVLIPDLPGEGLPGRIESADERQAVIEFSSPTTLIRPGMTAACRLKLH